MQFLKIYLDSPSKHLGPKTVNEPYIPCKVFIKSQEMVFNLSVLYFQLSFESYEAQILSFWYFGGFAR